MRNLITVLCFAIACSPVLAADAKKEPSEKQLTQQQRMKDCSAKAEGKKGDDRKAFMKGCLAGKDAPAPAARATTQQDKMAKCNADAGKKALKGDERKAFMSSCLKG